MSVQHIAQFLCCVCYFLRENLRFIVKMAKKSRKPIPESTRVLRPRIKQNVDAGLVAGGPLQHARRKSVSFRGNMPIPRSTGVKNDTAKGRHAVSVGMPISIETEKLPARRKCRAQSLHQRTHEIPAKRATRSKSVDNRENTSTSIGTDLTSNIMATNCKLSNNLIVMNQKYMEAMETINRMQSVINRLEKELHSLRAEKRELVAVTPPLSEASYRINPLNSESSPLARYKVSNRGNFDSVAFCPKSSINSL